MDPDPGIWTHESSVWSTAPHWSQNSWFKRCCFGYLDCTTRTFYGQLLADRKTVIPALDYWKENLHPEPTFNAKQWNTLYPPLITHKHGDINWKIVHRVLPTALSLNRMGVYATTNCHRCGATDTWEHAMLDCPTVDHFWIEFQAFVDKISNTTLTLTTQVKLFGKVKTKNGQMWTGHWHWPAGQFINLPLIIECGTWHFKRTLLLE